MKSPLISIVIPCYNQGHYLKEALESLQKCDQEKFEVIIVNDGSTDAFTNEYTKELQETGYNVIFQQNTGLGQARNNGIKLAVGKYILPLDADNKIYPDYLTESIRILEERSDVSVVYGNANFIGEKSGVLKPGPFNLQRLMISNYIDACAVIRKEVLDEVGYYDNMKVMGFEDWDLWLKIAFAGHKFYYVDKVLFDYRMVTNSMMRSLNANIKRQTEAKDYILAKYSDKLDFHFLENLIAYKIKKSPGRFFYRLILKKFFPQKFNRLVIENKIYKTMFYE